MDWLHFLCCPYRRPNHRHKINRVIHHFFPSLSTFPKTTTISLYFCIPETQKSCDAEMQWKPIGISIKKMCIFALGWREKCQPPQSAFERIRRGNLPKFNFRIIRDTYAFCCRNMLTSITGQTYAQHGTRSKGFHSERSGKTSTRESSDIAPCFFYVPIEHQW